MRITIPSTSVATASLLSAIFAAELPRSLSAQGQSLVVPAQAVARAGSSRSMSFFRDAEPRRVQLVLGEAHLRALRGLSIYELAFRKQVRDAAVYDYLRASAGTHMRVLASFSHADPRAPAHEFARNHSAPVEVFRGFVRAPVVATQDSRAVASFAAHESPTIAFSRPVAHVDGRSLVLTFEIEGGREGYDWVWPVDAEASAGAGATRSFGQACWPSAHAEVSAVVEGSLRAGMHVKAESVTPPDPVAAFLVLGASDKLAFGALPLPLRIAEPGCELFVSPDLLVQAMFSRGATAAYEGASWAAIPTPYLSSLRGSTVFVQHVFLHREASELRLRTSNATRATFAKAPPTLDASVVLAPERDAARGRVYLDFTPVIRLRAR